MLPARHPESASQAPYGIASSGQFIRPRDSGMLKVITPARIHDVGVVRSCGRIRARAGVPSPLPGSSMSTRILSSAVACLVTLALASGADAQQDTMRTRQDTMRTRDTSLVRQPLMMSAQARDSLIARMLDSASRVTDSTVARRLRDSVATLRALALTTDTTASRMSTQLQEPQRQQAMQTQQADSLLRRQQADSTMRQQQADSMMRTQQRDPTMQQRPTPVTSDQRVRVQKDGRPYPDTSPPANPPDPSGVR